MSDFGIVCEFNPFHNGHKYLFQKAREMGAERIVCVMSGNAVQRGELALTDKYERAEMAIMCGADLVIELPYPWCAASAEFFGKASVRGLSSLCTDIIFGSEIGNIGVLEQAAILCESQEFKEKYSYRLEKGEGAAAAYIALLDENGFGGMSSNDLLGISYIRALMSYGVNIKCHAIKRAGATINEKEIIDGELQSATAIRRRITEGNFDGLDKYVPDSVLEKITELSEGGRLTDISYIDRAVVAYLRQLSAADVSELFECGGGVGNRICSVANECCTYSELIEKLKTQRYTDAKLRRAVLYAITGVREEDVKAEPEYFLLLGANERGRELLSEKRRSCGINIITKPSDAPRESRQYIVGRALEAWFTLARASAESTDIGLKRGAYIEK
ncbi:MAG: nucleotidyltransferase family protein [Clostridia bacterium]|nr:nucleotidyltransferase family protein [Clostridia bacterium]